LDNKFPLLTPPRKPIESRPELEAYIEHRRREDELGSFFQMVATISRFPTRESLLRQLEAHDFTIHEQYGNLYSLETTIRGVETERVVPYFMFYDSARGVHLFFTRARKTDDMPETILSFISGTRDISNLWISPSLMHGLTQEFEHEFHEEFQMSYFTAVRNANTHVKAERRPDFDRTIQYTGADAKDTLREFEYLYGVYPKIIEVQIGFGSGFRIDGQGILTIRPGSTGPVFKALDMIVREAMPVAEAVLTSRFEKRSIGGIERWIQHPFSIEMPSGIRSNLERNFLEEVSNEYWQFIPILPYIEEEIPYLSGRFLDGLKNSSFDVEITRKLARVYPVEKMDIGTALRFCQFMSQSEDVHSTVGIVSERSSA
jgi:hypothetical protein